MNNLLEGRVFTQIIWNVFTWKIYLFSPFIYSVNHLFILVWMHEYLLYSLGYNSILLYILAQIISPLTIENFFSWFLCPFYISASLW